MLQTVEIISPDAAVAARDAAFRYNQQLLPYKMDGDGYGDRFASLMWEMFPYGDIDKYIALLHEQVRPDRPVRILDAGSGATSYAEEMSSLFSGIEWYALDAHRYRERYGLVRFTQGDVQRMEEYFPEGFFDLILVSNVAAFLADPLDTLFRQGYGRLTPGGLLFANRVPLGWKTLTDQRDTSAIVQYFSDRYGWAFVRMLDAYDVAVRKPADAPELAWPFLFAGTREMTVTPGHGPNYPHTYNVYAFQPQ